MKTLCRRVADFCGGESEEVATVLRNMMTRVGKYKTLPRLPQSERNRLANDLARNFPEMVVEQSDARAVQ
jgi:hypothetical protein